VIRLFSFETWYLAAALREIAIAKSSQIKHKAPPERKPETLFLRKEH